MSKEIQQEVEAYEENKDNSICENLRCIGSNCPEYGKRGDDSSCKVKIRNEIFHRAELERSRRPAIDKSERYGYIYLTTNEINGKMYIGQHKAQEFDSYYKGSGFMLWRSIEKYGWENFSCSILEWCSSKEELNEKEKYWIDKYDAPISENFYNIAHGGTGGDTIRGYSDGEREAFAKKSGSISRERWQNPEFREIVRKGHERYWNSLGARERASLASKEVWTPEKRKQASERTKALFDSEEYKERFTNIQQIAQNREEVRKTKSERASGKNNSMYGKHHTEESKEKNRQSHLGHRDSEETKRKKSEASKRIWQDSKYREKASKRFKGGKNPAARKVRCVETGEVFDTVKSVAEYLGYSSSSIVCATCKAGDTLKGYHWEYVNEGE